MSEVRRAAGVLFPEEKIVQRTIQKIRNMGYRVFSTFNSEGFDIIAQHTDTHKVGFECKRRAARNLLQRALGQCLILLASKEVERAVICYPPAKSEREAEAIEDIKTTIDFFNLPVSLMEV